MAVNKTTWNMISLGRDGPGAPRVPRIRRTGAVEDRVNGAGQQRYRSLETGGADGWKEALHLQISIPVGEAKNAGMNLYKTKDSLVQLEKDEFVFRGKMKVAQRLHRLAGCSPYRERGDCSTCPCSVFANYCQT